MSSPSHVDGDRPRVSVCIPTRDRAEYLGEALRSVLTQTGISFEVVVVDDGSRDGTAERVPELRDDRVTFRRYAASRGVSAARNRCLEHARGELIAWLDSDDVYEPGALRTAARTFDAHPGAVLVHGAHGVMDAAGAPLPDWPPAFDSDRVEPGLAAFDDLSLENYIASPTVVVRRSAHDRAGPYDETLERAEDWHMWLRIALCGDVAYRMRSRARYRYHPGGVSAAGRRAGGAIGDAEVVVTRIFAAADLPIPGRHRRAARARVGLAARALRAVGEAYTRDAVDEALSLVEVATRHAPRLDAARLDRLRAAVSGRDDFGVHVEARALAGALGAELAGTRFGDRLVRRTADDPEWQAALGRIARAARRVLPPGAPIAVMDKWDPTLRHLIGRPGRTFPDRSRLPDGYPKDDVEAIEQLEAARRDGLEFLVSTRATAWWMEHYREFARYLRSRYRLAWEDSDCALWDLS